ncbi:carbon-nitrogen hydrolase family protein [Sinorhizobium meliloti]|uniref:carbon-nitrogen hydrolase family protein n=1 Tax=Rhizobium meliloti TaxID=382 RepID=UPI0012968FA5|nr:carbon-nitrogen hydrolase family protein [Sinorhizobium meliloti]MQX63423.1 carbon-nitrogen hydrolase family protein [Sinorhizobium meliloti]
MRPSIVRAACLQMSPGNDLCENLQGISGLIDRAVEEGAELIALPEFATFLDRSSSSMRTSAHPEAEHPALRHLTQEALRHGVWLLAGSIVIAGESDDDKLLNRSFLISPEGEVCGRYDKIHLFNARLKDGREVGESRHYNAGGSAVLVRTPFAAVGLSVCYDLRFPSLYRRLARAGAEILTVPAAFAAETGIAHWEPLLRARAIENGCFVLAPATCGVHPGDWQTYGHAAIVDPWGEILAQCDGSGPGMAIATLDLNLVKEVRDRIPSLSTNPDYSIVECPQQLSQKVRS